MNGTRIRAIDLKQMTKAERVYRPTDIQHIPINNGTLGPFLGRTPTKWRPPLFGSFLSDVCTAAPAKSAQSQGFALSYRIHISMFGRQLLHLWTYKLRQSAGIRLKDLSALLNSEAACRDAATGALLDKADEGKFCSVFDAAFVGDGRGLRGRDGRSPTSRRRVFAVTACCPVFPV
jgi:hypothetical protein